MQNFKKWILENSTEPVEEGFMKNLALGGALMGAGMGLGGMMNGNKTTDQSLNRNPDKFIQSSSETSPDASEFFNNKTSNDKSQPLNRNPAKAIQPSSETSPDASQWLDNSDEGLSWNDKIGYFTPVYQQDGSVIYRTKNGDYKRVESKFRIGNPKYVKVN